MAENAQSLGWHRVCLNTIVRKEKVLDSERLRILPMGSRVNVVEQSGRRVKIDQPIQGWCSLNSSNGDTILKPLDKQQNAVAATPRSGQAAVSSLNEKVKAAEDRIKKAQAEGKDSEMLAHLNQEKAMLQARIDDMKERNAQQEKMLQEWKEAAEQMKTTMGTAPTDIESCQFRNGDAVMLAKTCSLGGIVIVRCVKKDEDGSDLIGCDYQYPHTLELFQKEYPDIKCAQDDADWKRKQDMFGVWLRRTDFKALLTPYSILEKMDQLNEKINYLDFFKRTAEAMATEVSNFAEKYSKCGKIKFGDEEPIDGKVYGKQFKDRFLTIQIMDG